MYGIMVKYLQEIAKREYPNIKTISLALWIVYSRFSAG